MKIKKEHRPLAQLDLHKHQAKIDKQMAEAHDIRKYNRMGGEGVRGIYEYEITKFDVPVTRNKLSVA